MVRSLVPVLALFLCLSAAAQSLSFTSAEPVSVARAGVAGAGTYEVHAASNGSTFLVVWHDDRQSIEARPGAGYLIGQAMRFAADGTPLDATSIALPWAPSGVVWAGTDWIVLTGSALTRIDRDGKVLETRSFAGAVDPMSLPAGIAWTGDALVILLNRFEEGLQVLTLNMALEPVKLETLTTGTMRGARLAGDGRSALVAWIALHEEELTIDAAAFGRDGLLQNRKTIDSDADYGTNLVASGTTGEWYALAVSQRTAQGLVQELVRIERDLTVRPIHAFGIDTSSSSISMTDRLVWDGTQLVHYSTIQSYHGQPTQLVATRITADGRIAEIHQPVFSGWDSMWWPDTVAAVNGATLIGYARTAYDPLTPSGRARVFSSSGAPGAEVELARGAFGQETPAVASSMTQSLVAWRERTTPLGSFSLYATRLGAGGEVLDPQSLLLSGSACREFAPAVASDGRDFLAVWYDQYELATAAIRADGSVTRSRAAQNLPGPCGSGHVALISNGTDYLGVWQEKVPERRERWEIYGIRLRANGTPIDEPFLVTRLDTSASGFGLHVASGNGDYLVVALDRAVRVTGTGAVLDLSTPIRIGAGGPRAVWWNGRTYVVWTTDWDNTNRFVRIGTDGSGGVSPAGPQIEPTPFPQLNEGWLPAFAHACDASGCAIPISVVRADGRFDMRLFRFDDDGTKMTVQLQRVGNSIVEAHGDFYPLEAGAVRVPGGPLVVIRQQQRMEQPYSGAHRIYVSPVGPSRQRSVRH